MSQSSASTAISPILVTPYAGTDVPSGSGGKVINLQRLARDGFTVPPTLFLPPAAYTYFVEQHKLTDQIHALAKADIRILRWEEIWDASLALRNSFLRHPMPTDIAKPLLTAVHHHLGLAPLAVRSCALHEDSGFSHAGVHDSVLDVSGDEAILKAVQQVWASLWTDRAVLYRQEMGLNAKSSAMGIILQAMIPGHTSGVLFTRDPTDESRMTIEAVHGPASEVVDDSRDTERLFLGRDNGKQLLRKRQEGNEVKVVLSDYLIDELYHLGSRLEQFFGSPQDIEWTATDQGITVLQSRPITTFAESDAHGWDADDKRPWYLSLTRSHKNLEDLREHIESEILPGMTEDSDAMKNIDLNVLSCEELEKELARRNDLLTHWRDVYWHKLIPFAHTVRQFGMLYNDTIAPEDPFEFTTLLSGQHLLALDRNAMIEELALLVKKDDQLAENLRNNILPEKGCYSTLLNEFMERFGDLSCNTSWCNEGPWGIIRLTLKDTPDSPHPAPLQRAKTLEYAFLDAVPSKKRDFATSVLNLARVGYRLRDDDNLYLGKIQARYNEALELAKACGIRPKNNDKPEAKQHTPKGLSWNGQDSTESHKQRFNGWAAAMGIAFGQARVVSTPEDLFTFQKGEVLICNALDPNMTFVVPMAAAIVERRGGMLVHGAIIAREYGIPCVTGIPDVTSHIQTGDQLMVDGFRGLVIIEETKDDEKKISTAKNVLGGSLATCCMRPMTGFFRRGSCDTEPQDSGCHAVCSIVTQEFLEFSLSQGNDLISPSRDMDFPGLVPGDRWCLCALRWEEARKANVAPPVILEATHEEALRYIRLKDLKAHEAKQEEK
ncbi:DUF2237 family protein [Halodesulfovibrio sp. MK-HDV]|jgi:uncharacterized protein (DUF2237 family)/phosphohistidine swiveling domain-containing protein|uniref:DUF2237 family protein n=1 Tax=Halodesulfovibrio sp. MK-HDV TaxID=2599925 RepID=UPI00137206C5|nr:DUF2237 family protein [Halodesulfovibrio sp. MK-HDV]KAF1074548.1 Prodigiosin synthesizing transferase PigC [Halodesulfovibrio sp. MK-HDV]